MTWLRQQRKVEALSVRATQSGLQVRELHQRMGKRLSERPGVLAWSFATGALAGSAAAQNLISRTTSMVNRAFVLWEHFFPISRHEDAARNPVGIELKTTLSLTNPKVKDPG